MIGAIIGDMVGAPYEFNNIKTTEFQLFGLYTKFTDDSVMAVATADSLLHGIDYATAYRKWYFKYPNVGYGGNFRQWCETKSMGAYDSWGNGSAMRVSPIGWAFDTLDETLKEAEKSAIVTHNHPEGIKGARVVAAAIFMARNGYSKEEIKTYIELNFHYDLNEKIDILRPRYKFDVSCQGSVPEAIECFLQSSDFEETIRNTVSIGGDCDTTSAISGSIAQAYYKYIPMDIMTSALQLLPKDMIDILTEFENKYIIK